jgi:hypothetical protein
MVADEVGHEDIYSIERHCFTSTLLVPALVYSCKCRPKRIAAFGELMRAILDSHRQHTLVQARIRQRFSII